MGFIIATILIVLGGIYISLGLRGIVHVGFNEDNEPIIYHDTPKEIKEKKSQRRWDGVMILGGLFSIIAHPHRELALWFKSPSV